MKHEYQHTRLLDGNPKSPCFPARTWPVVQGAQIQHTHIGTPEAQVFQFDGHCVPHTPLQRVGNDWRLYNADLPCSIPLGPGCPAWASSASWDARRALRRPVDAISAHKFKRTKLAVELHPQPMPLCCNTATFANAPKPTDTVNIAQNYPNPIRLDLFPGQNMAGSPGVQVDIARPSTIILINRNRQSRSGPPPQVNIAQNYPTPIRVDLFPGQTWPVVQVSRWTLRAPAPPSQSAGIDSRDQVPPLPK